MLSRRTKYGLKALVALAQAEPGHLTSAEIAKRAAIPRKFLEAILRDLVCAQFIASRRGKLGGYSLLRDGSQISFADVIRCLEGPLALAPCARVGANAKCDDCTDLASCSLRPVLRAVRDAKAQVLEQYTLAKAASRPTLLAGLDEEALPAGEV